MNHVFTPNDYCHLLSDSAMIQAAVDEAVKTGGTVIIPCFNERTKTCLWELDKTILLHSGSTVLLDNCHVRLKDNTYIHFFQNSNSVDWEIGSKLANRQYDISLEGRGNVVLDGGKPLDMCENEFNVYDKETGNWVGHTVIHGQTSMLPNIAVMFMNVERVKVSGLRFVNNRYWTMCFWYCSYGTVRDIVIEAMNNVPNQDGINLRVGCNNFLVENIYGMTGDDTIALTGLDSSLVSMSDMNCDIHHIIVRNVRSYQTGECDIVRILNRGGIQIYNVLLDGIMDITDAGDEHRALAAIRIGDLCDYQLRLNEPGETRNLVIRNVSTRARFGAYIANSLVDSSFDNLKVYGDGGIGMYFNGCAIKNVAIKDLCYDSQAVAPDTDIGYAEIFHRVKIDELSAVHFNNCTAENLRFDGMTTGQNLSYVFGGNSDLELKSSNLVILDERTQLSSRAKVL